MASIFSALPSSITTTLLLVCSPPQSAALSVRILCTECSQLYQFLASLSWLECSVHSKTMRLTLNLLRLFSRLCSSVYNHLPSTAFVAFAITQIWYLSKSIESMNGFLEEHYSRLSEHTSTTLTTKAHHCCVDYLLLEMMWTVLLVN